MSLPHLYLLHPPESIAAHIIEWLAEVQKALQADANWDGCLWQRTSYNEQAGFDVGTAVDQVRRSPGPVIFIQKVQAGLLARFRGAVQREVAVYSISPNCSMDLRLACEEARQGYEDGEPRIPLFELIAYLIISKLAKKDKWGGTALNKNFLWAEDLPKGGFPKGICTNREVLQVADSLFNAGLLTRKKSQGQLKYALGEKKTIQPILDSTDFSTAAPRSVHKIFDRSPRQVSARFLKYNDD